MFLTKVCKALNDAKLKYAVVGGYAVALHGAARGTMDVDVVISLSEKAFVAAEKVFIGLGLHPRLPVDARQVFQFRKEYIEKRNLVAWSFTNPADQTEQLDVIITENVAQMKIVTKLINGVRVQLPTIEDLIKMKKGSGRPQDLADVEALEYLRKR